MKDANEQLGGEVHRVRPGSVLSIGALGGGVCHPPSMRMCLPTWTVFKPCHLGFKKVFLWRFHCVGRTDLKSLAICDQLSLQSSPFPRDQELGLKAPSL